MKKKAFVLAFMVCFLAVAGCGDKDGGTTLNTHYGSPVIPTDTPAPTVTAVVRDNTTCSSGQLTITISQSATVSITAKNITSQWGKVKLNEGFDCWVELSHLNLNQSIDPLPVENYLPPPTIAPTITLTPVVTPVNTPQPLSLRWKILNYDCLNGKATGAIIGLDVSGGVADYKYSPEMPIYAQPGQPLSIKVNSNTSDGQPSGTINFMLPPATDTSTFICEKVSGNNPGGNPLPLEPPNVTDPPDPPDPPGQPVCYNPKGKEIPCQNK